MRKRDAVTKHTKRGDRMMRGLSLLATMLLLAVFARAQSQAPNSANGRPPQGAPPAQQNPPPIIVRTPTVIVPVTVKDSKGQLVGDLQRDEFRVFADGIEQPISGFSAEAVPLSAVVLIDNDLAERNASQVQRSLTTIAAGFGPADEVALVTYDQFPKTVADFSFNNDQLFTKLKRLELSSHNPQVIADPTTAGPIVSGKPQAPGSTVQVHGSQRYKNTNALNDALFASGEMLKSRGRDRRKIIFLISDGSNSRQNEHSFDETIRSLLSGDIAVYSISVTRSIPVGRAILQRGASEVDKYATDTGGDTFFASKQRDLERLYSSVTEQARNQYTLTFSPQDIPKNQDYHPIEVRVRRPDLNITARHGYYASAISAGH